ncbi:MAG TPA: SMP-30/gluconolactonase/LRE family protein [Rhodopila sp.]|nr:SMP-30/gluconolactonase/LRE family protein [Rhodopila sp.]
MIQTEVFAEVPKALHRSGESAWMRTNRPGVETPSFLEGPSFDKDGNLFVVDVPHGRVFRITPDGAFTVVTEYDGEPNGLKIARDGRIIITDFRHGLMQLDPASGKVTPLLHGPRSERFKGVNDLFFGTNGDLYFTDQGETGLHDPTGRVYRLAADGRLDCLVNTVPSPNGLVMDRHEKALYVAVTRGNCIWRLPDPQSGSPGKVGLFIQLSGGPGGPDGLALDSEGNLAIAHFGLGCVWLFSPHGEPLLRINSCRGRLTTNLAYGGADGCSLFITESESGCILRAELPVAGKQMFSHQE